jgi:hypothetical protein
MALRTNQKSFNQNKQEKKTKKMNNDQTKKLQKAQALELIVYTDVEHLRAYLVAFELGIT